MVAPRSKVDPVYELTRELYVIGLLLKSTAPMLFM